MKIAKNSQNLFILVGTFVLVLVTFLIFNRAENRPKNSSAYAAPSVGLLESNGAKLIVHAKSEEPDVEEQFVYCVTNTKNPDTCDWENSDEFELSEEGDYYIYVKSLASGKVSAPKLKTYKIIDYTNVKL